MFLGVSITPVGKMLRRCDRRYHVGVTLGPEEVAKVVAGRPLQAAAMETATDEKMW